MDDTCGCDHTWEGGKLGWEGEKVGGWEGGRVEGWQDGKVGGWVDGRVVDSKCLLMAELRNRVVGAGNCEMAEWQKGRMGEWWKSVLAG